MFVSELELEEQVLRRRDFLEHEAGPLQGRSTPVPKVPDGEITSEAISRKKDRRTREGREWRIVR